LKKAKS